VNGTQALLRSQLHHRTARGVAYSGGSRPAIPERSRPLREGVASARPLGGAPAAKTGRQRAASHNNMGNSSAPGTTVSQSCCGSEKTTPVIAASANRPAAPSICSLRGAGSRIAAENSITIGATVTTPTATPVHQCSQVVRICSRGTTGTQRRPPTMTEQSPQLWRRADQRPCATDRGR
jgi:hypothetical protein